MTKKRSGYGSTACSFRLSTIPAITGLSSIPLPVMETPSMPSFLCGFLCVPLFDPLWNHIENLSDVPPHLLKEIEDFFAIYKDLERKKTGIEDWEDSESALTCIAEARRLYREEKG